MLTTTKLRSFLVALFLVLFATATIALAQARGTIFGLRARYITVKASAKPEGDLKRQIEVLDAELAKAFELGRSGVPETLQRIKHIPQFVVHGDADMTVSVEYSRAMVAEMKRLGIEHRYIEVAGGEHNNVAAPYFRAMFDFFDSHRKASVK